MVKIWPTIATIANAKLNDSPTPRDWNKLKINVHLILKRKIFTKVVMKGKNAAAR